jgi:hypothetical protein
MRAKLLMSLAVALVAGCLVGLPAEAQEPVDTDQDGVTDDVDQCHESDLLSTVVIATCDSGVANQRFSTGCSLADLVAACAEGATNHGKYVSCVSRVTNGLKKSQVITGREKGAIQRCASRSDIGKKP